jgi:hypothetical protein
VRGVRGDREAGRQPQCAIDKTVAGSGISRGRTAEGGEEECAASVERVRAGE